MRAVRWSTHRPSVCGFAEAELERGGGGAAVEGDAVERPMLACRYFDLPRTPVAPKTTAADVFGAERMVARTVRLSGGGPGYG
jgi:hypothetical protein